MPAKKRDEGPAESGLNRRRIVAEAVRLADRDGVHALSMRGLAAELGAGAMSLYHYVAHKDELLDAMIDVVFDEIELPPADLPWREALRRRASSARRVLGRHRWALGLMESRTSPGPANLRHHEAVTACLRRAGFSVLNATHANWLLDSYIYGFALQESNLPFESAEFAGGVEDVYLPQLPPEDFPYLNESAAVLASVGYDPAHEFDVGLDLVLDALEWLRASAS